MPVNHADGTLFSSMLFYPVAAGHAALNSGAGWFTILFVVASVPLGMAIIYGGWKLVYALVAPLVAFAEARRAKWARFLIGVPLFLFYFALPMAIAGGGPYCVWLGTGWLVRHMLGA